MIKFENVSYSYPNSTVALKNVDLHIDRGERLSIVGNNGSGKTTLALLINGILRATSGKIEIDGLDPSRADHNQSLKQKVGLVFQNPDNQLVSTTVEREVAFSLENLNTPYDRMRSRVDKMLEFFGLSGFRERLTSDLSGGEKQKLALASVMVAEPDILILDEPGSYLDESGKRLLDNAINLLLAEKRDLTVLQITQYSRVARQHERMVVFKDATVIADGNPIAIFSSADDASSLGVKIPLEFRLNAIAARDTIETERPPYLISSSHGSKKIILDKISFKYDSIYDLPLFEGLDLTIQNEKVYGLVGCSGSGKTSLIQLMAGLLKPTRGRVIYEGFPAKPGQLAVSFQQPERQFFLETADKEIRFGAENLKLPDIDAVAEKCYELTGLSKALYSGRNPFTLSGGEKRRLAFGTIISLSPAFIFFDEPTCGLDESGIKLFMNLVDRLKNEGIGIVIVSHYGDIIMELADEVIALNQGRIDAVTSKENFFRAVDYSPYLSRPDLVDYQMKKIGDIRYFSETELLRHL